MADIDPNLAESAAKLTELFNQLGDTLRSSMDASESSVKSSTRTQASLEAELKKFGVSINKVTGSLEDDDDELKKRIKLQKEVNETLEKGLKAEAEAKGVSVETLKLQKEQNTASENQLRKLKDQLDSTVTLTKAQYDSINAAEQAIKAKTREIDNLKNADKNYASMITSITSVSGAIDVYKKKQLEAAEGNADATAKVVGKFALIELGTTAVAAGFNYIVDSTKAAYEGMMQFNRALVTGADGFALASTQQLAVMKAQQKSLGDASGSFLNVGKAAGGAALAMIGVAVMGGPVSAVALGLTALATLLGFGAAAILKNQEMEAEKAAQDLELGNMLKDKLYNSYMDIGKAGLVGSKGLTALTEDAHKAGFAIKDIDKFTSVLKNSQKEMSLFAGGAAAGVDKFASVTGEMTASLGDHFRNLGISVEEQAEETAKYMALQSRLGLLQGKTITDLASGAGKYLEELDKTATLLGTSRKEQEDARSAILGIQQLRAAMMAAEERNDTKELERLGRYLTQATELQAKGLTQEAAGFAKIGASKGAVTDKDTVIARQMYSNDLFNKIDKNLGSQTEQTRQLVKETKSAYLRTATGFAATGADAGMTGGKYGQVADMSKVVANQEAAAREAAAKKGLNESKPEYSKFFEDFLVEQKKATDKATTDANKLREDQQKANIAEDTRLIAFSDKYAGATNIFSDAVNKFASKTASEATTQSPVASTALRAAQQGASNQVAANYSNTQMTPEEARNVLDNGSERDIAAFGGREALTKIALSQTASQAAAPAASMQRMNLSVPNAAGPAASMQRMNLSVPNAAGPAVAPAASMQRMNLSVPNAAGPAVAPAASMQRMNLSVPNAAGPAVAPPTSTASTAAGTMGPYKSRAAAPDTASMGSTEPISDISKLLVFAGKSGTLETFKALDSGLQKAVISAASEYNKSTGQKIQVNSAKRDSADQKRLWDESVKAERPGIGPSGMEIARPGTSKHERGAAIDIQQYNDPTAVGLMNKYGMKQTRGSKDPVHFELKAKKGGMFNGPESGYPVEMHGNEIITPLSPNSILEQLGKTPATTEIAGSSSSSTTNTIKEIYSMNAEIMEMLAGKLDDMIDRLDRGNTYSDKLVKAMA